MKKKQQKMDLKIAGMSFDEPGQVIVMAFLVVGLLFLYGWTIVHATSPLYRQVLGSALYLGGPIALAKLDKLDGYGVALYAVPIILGIAIIGFN